MPDGGFVEGASGPDNRQRGGSRGYRGRGGGRGRFRRPPPPRVDGPTDAAMETEQVPHELPPHAMEVVNALADVEVPGTAKDTEVADRADVERASKYARKKERMLCTGAGRKVILLQNAWLSFVSPVESQHMHRGSALF